MWTGAYDRRGSSIAVAVDAAIERLVDQFETSDVALRRDVLRALSTQAHLAFETTRIRERLGHHPVCMELMQDVTGQSSSVYKTLMETLTVDSCSCTDDVKHNVIMATNVRWTLRSRATTKKRKAFVADEEGSMITKYRYERVSHEKGEEATLIKFSIGVAFGDNDVMHRELLYFEMASKYPYPKSYYEEKRQLPSDNGEEEGDGEESTNGKEMMEQMEQDKHKEEHKDESDTEQKDRETFGEEQRAFRFNSEVLADMGDWMGAGKEQLDPVDVVGFFVALPVHEDEWLVDERVCEILFQGGMGASSSDDECNEKNDDDEDDAAEL